MIVGRYIKYLCYIIMLQRKRGHNLMWLKNFRFCLSLILSNLSRCFWLNSSSAMAWLLSAESRDDDRRLPLPLDRRLLLDSTSRSSCVINVSTGSGAGLVWFSLISSILSLLFSSILCWAFSWLELGGLKKHHMHIIRMSGETTVRY